MEVILLERVEKLGAIGDVVKVKNGFARNYPAAATRRRSAPTRPTARCSKPIAPRSKPTMPTRRARGREGVEGRRRQDRPADPPGVEHRPALRFGLAPATSSRRWRPKAPRSTKSQIVLDRPIKAIGMHEVKVALHPEVAVTVKVNVARSPEEAELQAQGIDVMAADVREGRCAGCRGACSGGSGDAEAEEAPAAAEAEAEAAPAEAEAFGSDRDGRRRAVSSHFKLDQGLRPLERSGGLFLCPAFLSSRNESSLPFVAIPCPALERPCLRPCFAPESKRGDTGG